MKRISETKRSFRCESPFIKTTYLFPHNIPKLFVFFCFLAAFFLNGCAYKYKYPEMTVSGRGVILAGQQYADVDIPVPECPGADEFLVQEVHVGPELITGNTQTDVVQLPQWGVSVPVYQRNSTAGAVLVRLTAAGKGAEHISAKIPAGQHVLDPTTTSIPVRISLLGGVSASHRFEFNVHITGVCGTGFVRP